MRHRERSRQVEAPRVTTHRPRPRTGPKPKRKPVRLQLWLDANGFTSAQLEQASGICRQTMTQIKAGRDIRQNTMKRILRAARLLAQRNVGIEELFDFESDGDLQTRSG